MFHSALSRSCLLAIALAGIFPAVIDQASAQTRQGGRANADRSGQANRANVDRGAQGQRANVDRGSQAAARSNVNRSQVNQNVNRNAQVNQNVNVSRNVNVDVDDHNDYHPFATAAAVTAGVAMTSAVIGSMVNTLPPSCRPVAVNGVTYQQCGSAWYQPQYAGSQVTYVVVNPPQ